jgi:hypothetical protein
LGQTANGEPSYLILHLDEAEELYLDESLPKVLELLSQPIPDEELARHPLLTRLRVRGRRGSEDSLL